MKDQESKEFTFFAVVIFIAIWITMILLFKYNLFNDWYGWSSGVLASLILSYYLDDIIELLDMFE